MTTSAEEYAAKIIKLQQACLIPLKEDLADWLNKILKTSNITTENFMHKLDNGVVICRLAKIISSWCESATATSITSTTAATGPPTATFPESASAAVNNSKIWEDAKGRTFYARDNVCNFIKWTKELGVNQSVLFESDDLVLHANPRQVVLCLLDVARIAYVKYGFTEAPGLVKFEQEMDRELYATEQTLGHRQSLISDDASRRGSQQASDKQPPGYPSARNSLDVPIDATDELIMRYCRHKEEKARRRSEELAAAEAVAQAAVAEAEAAALAAEEARARLEADSIASTSITTAADALVNLDEDPSRETTSLEGQSSVIDRLSPLDDMIDSLLPKGENSKQSEAGNNDNDGVQDDQFAAVSSTTCDQKPHNTKNLAETGRVDSLDSGEGPTESASTGHSGSHLTNGRPTPLSSQHPPAASQQTCIPVPKTRTNFTHLSPYKQHSQQAEESSMSDSELSSSRSSLLSNQDGNNLNSNYERQATSDLDGKVMRIATSYYGRKAQKDVTRLSEGKYKIADRIVFVRLLKGHRVMVRIGGGWDTLENFLFRHKSDPSQVIDPDNLLPLETKMSLDNKSPQVTPAKSTTSSKLPYYRRSNSASSTNLSLSNLSISNHSLISSTTPTATRGRMIAVTPNSVQSSPTTTGNNHIARQQQQTPYLLINKGRQASAHSRIATRQLNMGNGRSIQSASSNNNNNSNGNNNSPNPGVSQLKRPFYYQKTTAPHSTSKYSRQRPLASSAAATTASATNLNLYPATLTITRAINISPIKSSGSTKFLANTHQGKVPPSKHETMRKFGFSSDSLPTSTTTTTLRKSPLHRNGKHSGASPAAQS